MSDVRDGAQPTPTTAHTPLFLKVTWKTYLPSSSDFHCRNRRTCRVHISGKAKPQGAETAKRGTTTVPKPSSPVSLPEQLIISLTPTTVCRKLLSQHRPRCSWFCNSLTLQILVQHSQLETCTHLGPGTGCFVHTLGASACKGDSRQSHPLPGDLSESADRVMPNPSASLVWFTDSGSHMDPWFPKSEHCSGNYPGELLSY